MALLKRKRPGLSDPMSVVTRFVNACNRHDADSVAACLHPDFDSIQPMYPVRNFRGADQVRRNWQAIFDAEPGFRLTVLRQAAVDDTVWLELHGAGRDAEVAGVFVMGVLGDRIRWARIYSALVEPLPEGVEPVVAPVTLREVPPLDSEHHDGDDAMASVVDIEGGGRSARRRARKRGHEPEVAEDAPSDEPAAVADETAEPEPEPEVVAVPSAGEAFAAVPDAADEGDLPAATVMIAPEDVAPAPAPVEAATAEPAPPVAEAVSPEPAAVPVAESPAPEFEPVEAVAQPGVESAPPEAVQVPVETAAESEPQVVEPAAPEPAAPPVAEAAAQRAEPTVPADDATAVVVPVARPAEPAAAPVAHEEPEPTVTIEAVPKGSVVPEPPPHPDRIKDEFEVDESLWDQLTPDGDDDEFEDDEPDETGGPQDPATSAGRAGRRRRRRR